MLGINISHISFHIDHLYLMNSRLFGMLFTDYLRTPVRNPSVRNSFSIPFIPLLCSICNITLIISTVKR